MKNIIVLSRIVLCLFIINMICFVSYQSQASFLYTSEVNDSTGLNSPSILIKGIADNNSKKKDTKKENTKSTLKTDITSDDFIDSFNPKKDGFNDFSEPFINVIVPIVNNVISIIQIIGAVVFVLSLAAAGLNGIIATSDGLAEDLNLGLGNTVNEYGATLKGVAQPLNRKAVQKIIRRVTIGSIFLMLSTTIVRIVFNVFAQF